MTAGLGLLACEATFGAGTMLAPMDGARLLRFAGRMQDAWSGGLHLLAEPTLDELPSWLATWSAFERPGRLRWTAEPRTDPTHARTGLDDDLVVASRPVLHGMVDSSPAPGGRVEPPHGVEVRPVADVRDWAGFEVLARWIDLDTDPDTWRWRARRVRHLVEGGRGVAMLARTTMSPVGAVVRLDAPEHHPVPAPTVVVVAVHQAHRRRGIGAALLAAVAAGRGPVVVLGDGDGHLVEVGRRLGLEHVEDLVEVGTPTDRSARKA